MQENMFTNWFNNRKVSDSILSEFNVHWGSSPIMGPCIVIPVHDQDNNFVFNKYRRNPTQNITPKYMYDKGGHVTLYGYWKAKEEKSILITEGEFDCLVAWSANIPAVTSTGGANSFQEDWVSLLADKEVTLCFDNDSAGGHGMAKVLMMIPHAYILFLPDRPGIKDITDYVASGGNLAELVRTRERFTCLQDVIDDRAKRVAIYQSTWFHDSFIELNTVPEYLPKEQKSYTSADASLLDKAKFYPINNLLKFDRVGNALCPWHNEKSSSLHLYRDSNTVYCFGCGKHGDSIDVYRAIHKCSFKEAISKLGEMI